MRAIFVLFFILFLTNLESHKLEEIEIKDEKPTLHIIGIFFSITSDKYSNCAFTAKVLKFSKMMKPLGWKIIEYGNVYTDSGADEFVPLLNQTEFDENIPTKINNETILNNFARTKSDYHKLFDQRLRDEMKKRVKDFDLILHTLTKSHISLIDEIQNAFHIESGIGYHEFAFHFRIVESYSNLHYLFGKDGSGDSNSMETAIRGSRHDWVIPLYFDASKWEFSPHISEDKPLVYMGRLIRFKGLLIIAKLAKALPHRKFKIAGQGNFTEYFGGIDNVEYVGSLEGKQRSDFLQGAAAMIHATTYVEPFGGSVVESQLCGVPVILTNFGAFVETIEEGKTGFRCNSFKEYLSAIEKVENLDRKYIRERAVKLYSLESVGKQFDRVFKQIYDLRDNVDGSRKNVSYLIDLNKPKRSKIW